MHTRVSEQHVLRFGQFVAPERAEVFLGNLIDVQEKFKEVNMFNWNSEWIINKKKRAKTGARYHIQRESYTQFPR